jgi:hypothetical protein
MTVNINSEMTSTMILLGAAGFVLLYAVTWLEYNILRRK